MSLVLVSDTSVLVDLHRGSVLDIALHLPYDFAVPDLLFDRELRTWDGPSLEGRVNVLVLDAAGVERATGYRRTDSRLSLPDAFALALAKAGGHTLLAGDANLRAMADAEGVDCHGVLWVLDEISRCQLATLQNLHATLTAIASHPRCRLPRSEIRRRLDSWSPGGS